MIQIFTRLLVLCWALNSSLAFAGAHYSLPADITSSPFNCSGSGPSYNCNSNINIAKEVTITLTADVTMNISGNFSANKELNIIDNGYVLNLVVSGNVNLKKDTNFTGNITASGNIDIDKESLITGNLTASGILTLKKDTTVSGTCTPTHPQCTGSTGTCGTININYAGFGGSEIKIEDSATNNGSNMTNGTYSGDAALSVGAVTPSTGVTVTLPDTDPVTLPANTSTTKYTLSNNETINATTDIYYEELKIKGSNHGYLSGGGPFHIGKLKAEDNTVLNVAAGIYYIKEFQIKNNAALNITSQPVIFYIGKNFKLKNTAAVTGNNITGFRIYMLNGSDKAKFEKNSSFTGMVYAPYGAKIEAKNNAQLNAQLITSGELKLKDNAALTFSTADASAVAGISNCQGAVTIDHFNINVGAGAGSTCSPFAFSVSAEDSSNNTVTDYTGTVDITTSTNHGDFAVASATNTLSPNPDSDDNGAVSYSFDAADNGQIDLTLDNNHAETLTLTVADSAAAVSTTSSSITFSENAFVIEDNDSQIAANNVPVAGRDHAYRIRMVRQDASTGICAVASGYNGAKNLKMWRTQNTSDPSASDPVLDGDSLPNADPATANGSITFNAGVADVLLSSSDIGKFTIELADISNSFSDSTIAGTSAEQIIRPFAIAIDFSGQRAADFADNGALDDSTGSDQSYAANSNGSVLTQAGEGFAITVRGVLWQAADDSDNDGFADSGAFVADNAVAVSFGAEGESVTLAATQFDPVAATLGSLSVNGASGGLFNNFSSGAQSATMTYSNVGIINLAAALSDGDYLGSGVNITGSADKVGRFNPYQYAVTSGLVNDACVAGAFTYARQPFSAAATIEAQNKSGARTDGYRDGFATLDIATELVIENSETGSAFDLQNVTLTEGFSSGTIGSAGFDLALRYDMGLQGGTVTLVEVTASTDEVTTIASAPVSLGSTEVRFGRLTLENAYGSELIDLTMPMQTEYYNGTNFIVNSDDDCSTIVDSDLIVVPSLSGGSSSVSVVSTTASSGILNINLTAPGAGNVGDIDLTADVAASGEDWLQFDWDGDGNDDNNPAAKATFGIYSGNSKQIYMRQIFQ